MDEPGKVHFRRMDEGADADFAVPAKVHAFCALYDEISVDPDYRSEPLAAVEPMVRRVLDKRWTPPS